MQKAQGNAILVTGASTGIGAACALGLARKGCRVFAGVRREEDGARLVEEAKGGSLEPVFLDVTKAEDVAGVRETLTQALSECGLHGLVNNAGIAVAGPLEFLPVDDFRKQIEVNLTGQLAVTQALLPQLRQAQGRIVFIGSTSGILSTPFLGPYCASKFGLEALTDAWRAELRPWKIEVSIVQPGPIETPIWKKSEEAAGQAVKELSQEAIELYGEAIGALNKFTKDIQRRTIPAARVADVVDHALFAPRPKTRYRVGKGAGMERVLARWIPDRLRDAIICRVLGI